jgi:DNA-binding response OmpR family regulator
MDTILIVEDERLFLTLARDGLEEAGFAVRVAESAGQALDILMQETIRAIILDVVMPDLNGLGFLGRLRMIFPQIPVVVVSGRDSPRSETEARRLGAAGCLRKPLNVDELVRLISDAILQASGPQHGGMQLPQLARLQQNAVKLSNMIRWDTLGVFLKDNQTLFQRVIDLIADVLEVEIVSLMLVTEPEGTLRIARAKGLDLAVQREAVCGLGEGISGRVAKMGEPLLIRDLSKDPVFGKPDLHPRYRTNSLMCVPVKVNGKTIGVLNANNKKSGHPFDESDLALFTTFSCLVSLSFATTQLFDKLASSVDELAKTDTRLAKANAELEQKVRELQALRGQPRGSRGS